MLSKNKVKSKRSRKAAMELSFGMIFAIILIVVFIAFAFYAIKKFLDIQGTAEVGIFIDNIQNDVDKMWKGSQGSTQESYSVPGKIKMVCIADYNSNAVGKNKDIYDEMEQVFNEEENLFFYPVGSGNGLDSKKIANINIEKITEKENPYCFDNNGKIEVTIKKSYGDALVMLERD